MALLRSVRREKNLPDPKGVLDALSRIGYSIEAALADLIDNSLDAKAKNVLIGFVPGQDGGIERAVIADDGVGMTEDVLRDAMTFGRPGEHTELDLGRYGMGLKSASFSQCDSLTVISRPRSAMSSVAGRRWTSEGIEDGWECDVLDADEAEALFSSWDWRPLPSDKVATVVIWEDLNEFRVAANHLDAKVTEVFERLAASLGVTFHRFLSVGKLNIHLRIIEGDALPRVVQPQDPFGHPTSGAEGFPKTFQVELSELPPIEVVGHVLPKTTHASWYRLGTSGEVANLQGFYFYRNDRLIQRGGWNGFRADGEPHFSLARARVDLAPQHDEAFALEVQKSGLDVPQSFLNALESVRSDDGTSPRQWVRAAEHIYRQKQIRKVGTVLRPGPGLNKPVREALPDPDPDAEVREVPFQWTEDLPTDRLVDVDLDRGQVLLNERYRKTVNNGARASVGDAPLFKVMAFLLLEEHFGRSSRGKKFEADLDHLNSILLAALEE